MKMVFGFLITLSLTAISQAKEFPPLTKDATCVSKGFMVHVTVEESKSNPDKLTGVVAAYPIVNGSARINVSENEVSSASLNAKFELTADYLNTYVSEEKDGKYMLFQPWFTVGSPSGFIIRLSGKTFDLDLRNCTHR